ncbi:MAG: ATP-binding protein [Armatimonadota bacterium]|nr:ATP-binding protein [Armatimonadota bacterium]
MERGLIRTLAEGRWLHEHLNLILCGPTGVGKTYIASALGNAACRQGFAVRYDRVSRLAGDLILAKADGSYPRGPRRGIALKRFAVYNMSTSRRCSLGE